MGIGVLHRDTSYPPDDAGSVGAICPHVSPDLRSPDHIDDQQRDGVHIIHMATNDSNKNPNAPAPAAGGPAPTPPAKKKKLDLDVTDVSEVLERKISPAVLFFI